MRLFILLICSFFLIIGCEEKMEEYRPPVLEGTAYILAAADHLAVVNLENQDLSRIKIDKMAVDITATSHGLFLLSEDGELGKLPEADGATIAWQKVAEKGRALTEGENGEFLVLGGKQLVRVSSMGKIVEEIPISEDISSLVFDAENHGVWLLSRINAEAKFHSLAGDAGERTITLLGNSIHQGFSFPGKNELWIAEGNEFMNGEPYGVGFMKQGAAVAGGINVFDGTTGKQTDFIMVGGNVVDLTLSMDKSKVYAAVSRMPDYKEATLSIVGSESRRPLVELRLCLSCHETEGVLIEGGQAEVLGLAIVWEKKKADDKK